MRELIVFFIRRIKRDEIMLEAASLSFTTILALVPALTVIVSIFAMIPAFAQLRSALEGFVMQNFMPVFSDAISMHISGFIDKAGSTTLTGAVVLVIISLMLVRSVDKSINRIWRGGSRRKTMTFAIYWTLLTVGPLAIALTLWLFSKLVTMRIMGLDFSVAQQLLLILTPIIIEMAVVTTVFLSVPIAEVRAADAIMGAAVVTVLFEVSKKLFATFIINFSDYEAVYGALAALPVLMIWININWWIMLLGAEFTSCLGLVRKGRVDEVPALITALAGVTGGSLGTQQTLESQKRQSSLRIKISKRPPRR